ncbi:MAG: hypothetical protein DRJ97_04970 [Thermoprotei archaeon]|nr:MAG: hypothetical protein DRJ97_04970 [Thermoprotei archaeon]
MCLGLRDDGAIAAAIFTAALLVRLPYLMEYPVFRTDELAENLRALAILKAGYLPLTNNAAFIGALYNYLAALAYLPLKSTLAFRLLVALFGAATPPLLYLVAKELVKLRRVGLYSSTILAFMPPHILVASHVAWSASLTPFLLLLSTYTSIRAVREGGRVNWLLTGLCVGLALQAHPSVTASYVGLLAAATYVLGPSKVKELLRGPNLTWILAGFALGYANMLAYNILVPLGSLTYALTARWTGLAGGLTLTEYLRRLSFIASEYWTMMPTGIPIISTQRLLRDPAYYVFNVLLVTTLALAATTRLGRGLLIYLASSILVLAVGTKGTMTLNPFGFAWGPHYLQQLAPFTALILGLGIDLLGKPSSRRGLLALAALAFMALWPYASMMKTVAYLSSIKATNKPLLEAVDVVKSRLNLEAPVYIEAPYVKPKRHVYMLLRELMVLEGFNVHPKPFLKEPPIKAIMRFIAEVKSEGVGVAIVGQRDAPSLKLMLRELKVNSTYLIEGPGGEPLFKLLVLVKASVR